MAAQPAVTAAAACRCSRGDVSGQALLEQLTASSSTSATACSMPPTLRISQIACRAPHGQHFLGLKIKPFLRPFCQVISRSGEECVVALTDQWYMTYGEPEWQAVTQQVTGESEAGGPQTENNRASPVPAGSS